MSTYYLAPGPSMLPLSVKEELAPAVCSLFDGVSILELAGRDSRYEALTRDTLELVRAVLGVPATHAVIVTCQGAQQHFSLLVQQLSEKTDTVAYGDTDHWAMLAVKEAALVRAKTQVFSTKEGGYRTLPAGLFRDLNPAAKFLHLTVNNTVSGTEFKTFPSAPVPLVLDMTSSIAARTDIPWAKTVMVYAALQKNLGIAGASLVIIEREALRRSKEIATANGVGLALQYYELEAAGSIYNTPPVFAVFTLNRMLNWIKAEGGIKEMERLALAKARVVYAALGRWPELYRVRAEAAVRSRHNFVFEVLGEGGSSSFIAAAGERGFQQNAGHKSLGGVRASLYNGHPLSCAQAFAEFIDSFAEKR